jgi:hypothetical protein
MTTVAAACLDRVHACWPHLTEYEQNMIATLMELLVDGLVGDLQDRRYGTYPPGKGPPRGIPSRDLPVGFATRHF